ncbi:XRE family transcriptional regulator [Streptomyces sp. NBC_01216]|uniref:XRE family transcriptional regulator n=1 Tax=Streptomyces sp. NBC_01216 TaxID=2903778 RepID=UPI002E0D9135|nr:XRE family transcriptional regulator [Streptomyces sp. NBC_01216]
MATADRPTTLTGRTDLSDLVRDRRAELRLSLRGVEGRTVDPATGEPLCKYSWVNKLGKGLAVDAPTYPQLRALAVALELPLGKIQDAAGAQFFGIDTVWSVSGEARALAVRADRMTPEQREQLLRLIETFAPSE